mmetsp:Transcript_5338/g.8249  ORF Transcript_5338/g.8249 Transcript_5338/m.8249 type:complete len:80 (+) Transcript_5338:909-1148(+)
MSLDFQPVVSLANGTLSPPNSRKDTGSCVTCPISPKQSWGDNRDMPSVAGLNNGFENCFAGLFVGVNTVLKSVLVCLSA